MTEILLDTNVLVYALDQDSRFHLWASRFFHDENVQCVVTSKNISEFLCVTTRGDNPALTIASIALSSDVRRIATVNGKDFDKIAGLEILTPP